MASAHLTRPVFYLLAGPNGAGKSTLYHALKAAGKIAVYAEFVNADLYEAAQLQHIHDPMQRSEATRKPCAWRTRHCCTTALMPSRAPTNW